MPIVAGAGASSTKETIEFCKEAAEAGADCVIVIPPPYFAGYLLRDGMEAVKQLYVYRLISIEFKPNFNSLSFR